MRGSVKAMLVLAALTAVAHVLRGCGGDCPLVPAGELGSADADPPPTLYNQVFRFVTHNSYWVNREHNKGGCWPIIDDGYASGVEERLLDQLLIEHVRGVEIDVHPELDSGAPAFPVYHTDERRNSFCATLGDCLRMLRVFHYALPQHEVVNVVVELKPAGDTAFPPGITPAVLDEQFALLGDANGSWLYRPSDQFQRCPGSASLTDCVERAGWPTTSELRGRFIVTVLAHWQTACAADGCVGLASSDWITYATSGDGGVVERAAFPMVTNSPTFQGVAGIDDALAASVFWQVERLDDPEVPGFLARNGVVRGKDAFSAADQQARLAAGFQLVQTDYPWFEIDQAGPDRPFHARDGRTFAEPGLRLLLRGSQLASDRYSFAATAVPAGTCTEWSTLASTTRPTTSSCYPGWLRPRGQACLRAATDAEAADADAVSVCRQVVDRENTQITVETCAGGRCSTSAPVTSTENGVGGVGDLLRLRVCTTGDASSVRAFSASLVDDAGNPEWVPIADATTSSSPLVVQGIAATGDVLFVDTRRDGQPVRGADLAAPVVTHKPSDPARNDAVLVDLSHGVGRYVLCSTLTLLTRSGRKRSSLPTYQATPSTTSSTTKT
jgi:hypothetical protein